MQYANKLIYSLQASHSKGATEYGLSLETVAATLSEAGIQLEAQEIEYIRLRFGNHRFVPSFSGGKNYILGLY